MKIEIIPLTNSHLPSAGALLAARHKRNRSQLPLLPQRFEDPAIATAALQDTLEKKHTHGYAALRGDTLVAYLIGSFYNQSWGRCGYVYLPGYGLAGGESPELIQELYARLGDDWVRRGIFSHSLYVSAAEGELIHALFNTGFGCEAVNALLDLQTLVIPQVEAPGGITIRRVERGDNAHLGGLSDLIFRALANAPCWLPTPPEDWDELYEGWSELADDEQWLIWLAFDGNQAIGLNGFVPLPEEGSNLLASPRTVNLSIAATRPAARGGGLSTHLTWLGLEEMRKAGYELCFTGWISSNLQAARHWPKFGFKEAAFRLSKRIDPAIAWTRE